MFSVQMHDPIMGANRLQPCNFATIPSHKSKPDPYTFCKPQSPGYRRHQASTGTSNPKDKTSQAPRYHDHSSKRPTPKCNVSSEHMAPQADVSKHGTSVRMSQQNSCLPGGVNDVSGPKRSQGPYNDQRRTRARDPDQRTVTVVVSPGAENTQPNGYQPPGAPPIRSIPLPGGRQEGDEQFYYGYGWRPVPGSMMTGTVDSVPKVLSPLDMALPVPFPLTALV